MLALFLTQTLISYRPGDAVCVQAWTTLAQSTAGTCSPLTGTFHTLVQQDRAAL